MLGGSSVDIHFGEGKAVNIPLVCKDLRSCGAISVDEKAISRYDARLDPRSTSCKYRGINLINQTILLVADVEVILNQMYFQGGLNITGVESATKSSITTSSRLSNFLDTIDPTKSFLDLSLILDEPVEEVCLLSVF